MGSGVDGMIWEERGREGRGEEMGQQREAEGEKGREGWEGEPGEVGRGKGGGVLLACALLPRRRNDTFK